MTVQDAFTEATWSWIELRLKPLNSGNAVSAGEERRLPFLLSKDFAKHFEAVLRDVVIPRYVDSCAALMRDAHALPQDQWALHFTALYLDAPKLKHAWERWQKAWSATMVEQIIPAKPIPEPKKSALKSLFKKKEKPKPGPKPLTLEQWKAEVLKRKIHNKTVRQNWMRLMKSSDLYVSPSEDDSKILRNLFGMSAAGLNKHIHAIRQIVVQGNNVGRVFDQYQHGKDVDLALLATCYKQPDPLIEGDGVLTQLMLAHSSKDYPLTARFLPTFFKQRAPASSVAAQ